MGVPSNDSAIPFKGSTLSLTDLSALDIAIFVPEYYRAIGGLGRSIHPWSAHSQHRPISNRVSNVIAKRGDSGTPDEESGKLRFPWKTTNERNRSPDLNIRRILQMKKITLATLLALVAISLF